MSICDLLIQLKCSILKHLVLSVSVLTCLLYLLSFFFFLFLFRLFLPCALFLPSPFSGPDLLMSCCIKQLHTLYHCHFYSDEVKQPQLHWPSSLVVPRSPKRTKPCWEEVRCWCRSSQRCLKTWLLRPLTHRLTPVLTVMWLILVIVVMSRCCWRTKSRLQVSLKRSCVITAGSRWGSCELYEVGQLVEEQCI